MSQSKHRQEVRSATIGYPRLGGDRELKWALEAYWDDDIDVEELRDRTSQLREQRWQKQSDAGVDIIPSNDFSLYDHVLDTARMVGAVPERYERAGKPIDRYFTMARGAQAHDLQALEMTKWFDTNYHYIVPELASDQKFEFAHDKPVREYNHARQQGIETRPVLVGPITFLKLSKMADGDASVEPIEFVEELAAVYAEVLASLDDAGASAVQIDEPMLVTDLADSTRQAYRDGFGRLESERSDDLSVMLTTYFGPLRDNLSLACDLPVDGLHLDCVRGSDLTRAIDAVDEHQSLSLGLVDGRNVWRTDLDEALEEVETAVDSLGAERVDVAASCSMLHVPVDVEAETNLDDELQSWLAFADQKLTELSVLASAANEGHDAVSEALDSNRTALASRRESIRSHRPDLRDRLDDIDDEMMRRDSPFDVRNHHQEEQLDLPELPTTTIGSFPQRSEIRSKRASYRKGNLSREDYEDFIAEEIERTIRAQEEMGLDLLVHGESERSDMVEYFAQKLTGFALTDAGWVQSYGSRGVRPPIIYGDVERESSMTVDWTTHADELTDRPVKGILTGPVTMVNWSFVRDDQPKSATARQIALAVRDEVDELEANGIPAIQVDEPALREGLPLRESDHEAYLEWAVEAFTLATCTVDDRTQIQTHMCYSNFEDIIDSVRALDADVLFIEASRSGMELLDVFAQSEYPNDLGLGVYDIHSPRVPPTDEMVDHIERAVDRLGADKFWVNPDCGLKTRSWEEVEPSLTNMVEAAKDVRAKLD